jgi:hypothetical protein
MIVGATVEVSAPIDVVWRAAVDWPAQARWMPLTTVAVVSGDGAGVGTRVCARTGVGRVAAVDPMEIDVWQPPLRCEVRHLGRVVRGRGVFRVEAVDPKRSRFTWEEQLPESGVYGVLARLGAPLNRAVFTIAVRRFARWVEAGQP